jgi:hypothetical protein
MSDNTNSNQNFQLLIASPHIVHDQLDYPVAGPAIREACLQKLTPYWIEEPPPVKRQVSEWRKGWDHLSEYEMRCSILSRCHDDSFENAHPIPPEPRPLSSDHYLFSFINSRLYDIESAINALSNRSYQPLVPGHQKHKSDKCLDAASFTGVSVPDEYTDY